MLWNKQWCVSGLSLKIKTVIVHGGIKEDIFVHNLGIAKHYTKPKAPKKGEGKRFHYI